MQLFSEFPPKLLIYAGVKKRFCDVRAFFFFLALRSLRSSEVTENAPHVLSFCGYVGAPFAKKSSPHLLVLLGLLPPPPPLQSVPLRPALHHGVQGLPQHQVSVVEAPHACRARDTTTPFMCCTDKRWNFCEAPVKQTPPPTPCSDDLMS